MPTLLVEDNARLRASLLRGFGEWNWELEAVSTGQAAIARLARHDCDAVILDLGLPDMDGLEVLVAARQSGMNAPVLVLSARDEVTQRVQALDCGADDYLVKPFVFAELLARLRALVRRASGGRASPLCVGDLVVDAESPRAQIGTRSVVLSPREHALLQHLIRNAGQVAKRREILSHVFGCKFDPGTNVIDVHVAHLRRKLEGSNVRVETVRGEGYRLQRSHSADSVTEHDAANV
jgi:two-component system copper resistance phosphate regulon response regulator CusR